MTVLTPSVVPLILSGLPLLADTSSAMSAQTALQWGIPGALTALVGALVWMLKWLAGQVAEQNKAMGIISERAASALATQTETNRQVAAALQALANEREIERGIRGNGRGRP